ncbi:hypothetical protein A3086_24350 [Salmonella enterica subsp. enterica serovar Schwarzengrund]|nr:hypothetical protein [Salmonella enterica subsp. enterica serovar Schwarzengrund]
MTNDNNILVRNMLEEIRLIVKKHAGADAEMDATLIGLDSSDDSELRICINDVSEMRIKFKFLP